MRQVNAEFLNVGTFLKALIKRTEHEGLVDDSLIDMSEVSRATSWILVCLLEEFASLLALNSDRQLGWRAVHVHHKRNLALERSASDDGMVVEIDL